MKKDFIRFSIVAILVTVLALYFNSLSIEKRKTSMDDKDNNLSTSVSNLNSYEKNNAIVAEGIYFNPVLNNEGSKLLFGNGDNIYEMMLSSNEIDQLTKIGGCYNPSYSKDDELITFARSNGIYILDRKSNEIKKVISSDDPQKTFAKPNFTPEGDIIYFSVTVQPGPEGHGFVEKEPGIYRISKDGKNNEKIIEGYNPALSNDGIKLAYELKEKIYTLNLQTKENKLIDIGRYASWSPDSNCISYTKFEKQTSTYKKGLWHKNLYLDKDYSNIWIADISSNKKFKVTKEEFEDKDFEIKEWAKEAIKFNTEQHFLVPSKQSFFDSTWGQKSNELYALRYSSKTSNFELVRYDISLK